MIEVLKQMVETLEYIYKGANNQGAHTGISWRDVSNKAQPAIQAGRQAIAELESQEPVEFQIKILGQRWTHCAKHLYDLSNPNTRALYTHPPQRTWVGLDHYDKKKFSSWLDHKSDDEVFTAIEAKLKELNDHSI